MFLFVCLFFKSKVLHFGAAQFINLLFYGSWFWPYIAYKNLSPNPRSHRFSSILPEVFCFTFKFIIHLNLDFVAAGLRYVSVIFVFANGCPIFPVSFVEETLLFVINFLCTFVDVSWKCFSRSISGIYILFHLSAHSIVYIFPILSTILSFSEQVLKPCTVDLPNLLFFRIILVILVHLPSEYISKAAH